METKILEEIGLTPGEIKVYLALLESGPSSAGEILEKAKIQNSVFHFCVNRLIEKGLVSYIKKGKIRVYQAAEPNNFLVYLKDKENELAKLLPELKARQTLAKEKQMVEMFEGIKGVMTLMNELITGAKKGEEFLFFPPDVDEIKNQEIQKFYEKYDHKRKDQGLITRGIAPIKLKPLFEKRAYLQMKYSKAPVPFNSAVCGNKMAIITWAEKPTGVLIQSKHLAERQREFFKALWEAL